VFAAAPAPGAGRVPLCPGKDGMRGVLAVYRGALASLRGADSHVPGTAKLITTGPLPDGRDGPDSAGSLEQPVSNVPQSRAAASARTAPANEERPFEAAASGIRARRGCVSVVERVVWCIISII